MAEEMAKAIATTRGKRNGSSTPATTTPAENGSSQKPPEAVVDDSTPEAEAKQAMEQEQRNAQRDPSKVVIALRKVVRIAMASDLKKMALGMVQSAKKGNTIAMKLLIELCNVVDQDAGEDGLSQGIKVTDLFAADLEWENPPESENPATSEPAGAGIDAVLTGEPE
jgi:hypothetical protein